MRLPLALLLLAPSAFPQDFSEIRVEKVASGFTFTEGPVWAPEGYLLFSDIPANTVLRVQSSGTDTFRESANGAIGNTFDAQGRLYSCESHTRRVVRVDKKGKLEVLADKFEGKRFNAPNDIVVRKDGHIYFTDPAFGSQSDTREMDFFGIYHISPKGEIEAVAKLKTRPNGIALAPNGKTLFVANSDEKNVRAYDLDRSGRADNERVVVSGIEGSPDGMKLDEKGNLYIATNGVSIYSPQGKLLRFITMPETPSNLAWGEQNLQSLLITARTSVYRVRLDVKGSVQYEAR